jgi:uncharacterized protein with beta-barrel porin domain
MNMVRKIGSDAPYATALLRGGRLIKWKGQAASLSPSLGQLIASVSVFALGRALAVGARKSATAAVLGGVGLILTTSGVSASCVESTLGSGVHTCSDEIIETVTRTNTKGDDQLTITSSAIITGDTYGIYAANYGSGALSITTTGTTTGTDKDGIAAWNYGTDLTIDAATTSGGAFGIYAANYGSGALSITTTGTTTGGITNSDKGIAAWNYGSDLTINASITTGGRDGIYAENQGIGALRITTTGTTTGTGISGIFARNGAANRPSGTDLTINAATTMGGTGGIVTRNFGTGALNITTTGTTTGSSRSGIDARNYNGSDLTINAATTTGSTDGIYAKNYGTGALSITTSGAITGGTGYGIKAKTTAGKTVNITLNSGSAVSSAAGLGIFNDGGNSTTTVKAGASVAGKIVLGAGDDNLVLAGGDLSAVTLADGGDDTDTLTFSGPTAQSFDLDAIGSAYKNFEAFVLKEGETSFSGTTTESFTIQNSATLSGTGTFGGLTFQSGATAAPGNSIGTTTVNGAVTFDAGSTYEVEINPDSTSDLIEATGTATINGGSVSVLPEAGLYSLGTTNYTILSAAGGVTGTFHTHSMDQDLAFLTPTLRYDASNVFLDIERAVFSSVAETDNQVGLAKVLDGAFGTNAQPGSDNETVLAALTTLTTAEARTAFKTMSGEVHSDMKTNVLTSSNVALSMISNRVASPNLNTKQSFSALGFASHSEDSNFEKIFVKLGKEMAGREAKPQPKGDFEQLMTGYALAASKVVPQPPQLQTWMRTYAQTGTTDGTNGSTGSDTAAYGALLGLETEIRPGGVVGLAFGYGKSEISMPEAFSALDTTTRQVLAYGQYTQGPWSFQGTIGYAHHEFFSDRNVIVGAINRNATANYDGDQFIASAELGYTYQYPHKVTGQAIDVQLNAGVNYGHLSTDSFEETGASSLNLSQAEDTSVSLSGVLGVKISSQFQYDSKTITPYLQASWSHDFRNSAGQSTTSFDGGGSFTTTGHTADEDSINIGFGATAQLGDQTSAFVDYTAKLSGSQTQHTLSIGLRMIF